jgi:ubiquinone/menaquinone biosynthesis C-methylase UbiE
MNLKQLEANFEALAADDPLWTVLSDKKKRGGKWDEAEFYQTGEGVIEDLRNRLSTLGLTLKGKTAIDFGCGVGRLTFPLSRHFATCFGIDISQSMVDFAQSRIERGPNSRFLVNADTRLPMFENASVDLVYSAIVFQHIAPRYTREYLKEFARMLQPGGLLIFQLPSHLDPEFEQNRKPFQLIRKRLHYRIKTIAQKLPLLKAESFFEMNAIRRESLLPFLRSECGLETLDTQDFPAAGPAWVSYLYIARKP